MPTCISKEWGDIACDGGGGEQGSEGGWEGIREKQKNNTQHFGTQMTVNYTTFYKESKFTLNYPLKQHILYFFTFLLSYMLDSHSATFSFKQDFSFKYALHYH